MDKSVIEVTPKTMFGYILFFIGIILLGYIGIQCFLLGNGTLEPLKIGEELLYDYETQLFLGIMLQIGMNGLVIAISFILMKIGLNIARTKS